MYTYKLGGMLITDELYHDDLEAVTFGRKDQNELMHYGIKGQSWGKRRFQNEDGSLTAAGRNRYDVGAPLTGTTAANMSKNLTYKTWNGSSNGYGGAGGGKSIPIHKQTFAKSNQLINTGSKIGNASKNVSGYNVKTNTYTTPSVRSSVVGSTDAGKKAVDNIFGRIGNWASNAAKDVGNAASSAYNDASKFVNQAGQDISRTAGNVGNAAGGAFNDAKNWVGERAQDVGRVATSAYNNAARAVGNAAKDVGNFATNAANDVGMTVGNWVGDAANDIGKTVSGAANAAGNAIGNAARDAGDWVGDRAQDVGNAVNGAAKDVANWGAGAVESGKNFFNNLFGGGNKEPEQPTLSDPNERIITENTIPEQRITEQRIPEQRITEQRIPEQRINDSNSSMSDKPSNVSDEFWREYTFNGGTREQYDAEMQRMRNQNANRQQSSNDMSDKPSNVSDEFWREYTFNGGTRDSYDREMSARKNSAVPLSSDKDYAAEQKRLRNIAAQQDRNGFRVEEVNAPVGAVDNSRPHHFTYDPASGQTIVVYDDEKRR